VLDFMDPVRPGGNLGAAGRDAGLERNLRMAGKIGNGSKNANRASRAVERCALVFPSRLFSGSMPGDSSALTCRNMSGHA
jgi:hypothetical protein